MKADDMLIKQLLGEVSDKIESRDFNVFEVIGVNTKEVNMCRFLTELLKPDGSHKQGRVFLDLFFERVLLKPKPSEGNYINVIDEWPTAENRRIDIVIEYDDVRIPIEVKIYAGEQENQCADYLDEAKDALLYYLTINGEPPSDFSARNVELEQIQPIKWSVIHDWLIECIKKTNAKSSAFLAALEQFAVSVKNFSDKENDIMEIIMSEPRYVKAALRIIETKDELIYRVIDRIDEELQGKHGFKAYKGDEYKEGATYHTGSKDIYLRIHGTGYAVAVCFYDKSKKPNELLYVFDGANPVKNWNYKGISEYDSFHLFFDNDFDNDFFRNCIDNIVRIASDFDDGRKI